MKMTTPGVSIMITKKFHIHIIVVVVVIFTGATCDVQISFTMLNVINAIVDVHFVGNAVIGGIAMFLIVQTA